MAKGWDLITLVMKDPEGLDGLPSFSAGKSTSPRGIWEYICSDGAGITCKFLNDSRVGGVRGALNAWRQEWVINTLRYAEKAHTMSYVPQISL